MIGAGTLTLISVVYGVLGIRMAWSIWHARRSLFDDQITAEDLRLAQGFAFYLLWPPAVLLHEGGHALLAALFGAHGIRLHFYGYWGEITYPPTLIPRQDWWVALAGNAVTYGLGLIVAMIVRFGRLRLIWRIIFFFFAANQWFVVLLWYPGLCLTRTFLGDFSIIYGTEYWWTGSGVVAGINLVSLGIYLWLNYTDTGKIWVQRHLWRVMAVRGSE